MVIFGVRYHEVWASLAAQLVKNLPAMQEAWVGMPICAPKTPQGECPPGTELAEGKGRGAPRRLWQERRRVPSKPSIGVGKPVTSTIPGTAQEGSRGWGGAHEQELRPGRQPSPCPDLRSILRSGVNALAQAPPKAPRPSHIQTSGGLEGSAPKTACMGGVLTASRQSRLP